MDLGLKDHVALVAAASRGLGKAAAAALAAEGADVAICAHSERVEVAAEEIRAASGRDVLAVRADLNTPGAADAFVAQSLERFGRIDILVANNAGPSPGGFLDFTPEDWEAAVNQTILSTVRLCYAAVPPMLERGGGSIVAMQSYTVKQPLPNLILSNSLRLAVVGMVKSMALELGPQGIRVNSIHPAWTKTERVRELMADRAARNGTTPEEETAKQAREMPLGRMAEPEELGRVIAWLASPAASFIHGHALMVDGGAVNAPL